MHTTASGSPASRGRWRTPDLERGRESSSKAYLVSDQSKRRPLTRERELWEPFWPN